MEKKKERIGRRWSHKYLYPLFYFEKHTIVKKCPLKKNVKVQLNENKKVWR